MRTLVRRVLAAIALTWLAAGVASAAGLGGNVGGNPRDQKPTRYFVLQVLGSGGEMSFEVCGDTEYIEKQNTYKKEFQTAQTEWLKAKNEAAKRKEKFTEAKPKGPTLVRKFEQTFRKEEDAKAYAEKLQKKYEEAMEKKKAQKEEGTKKVEGNKEEAKKEETKEEK